MSQSTKAHTRASTTLGFRSVSGEPLKDPCSIIFLYNPVVFRFRVGLGTRAMRTNVRGTDLEAQGNLTDLEVELVDLYTQTLHVCHICLH